ncbi:MAG TPA: GAF domain-containing protein, partial [Methylophilaceae bacterium]|nr:GAF domain-containing protein [Methylophilaceae bacterium]
MQDFNSEQESERLRVVASYEALDTPPEDDFDHLTRLAADIFNVPIATITIVDKDRQWFKSSVGLQVTETERCISFCTHTIQHATPFIINNALEDSRFQDNPLVLGPPNIRFYAGIPLINPEGIALGSFCLIDSKPRTLTAEQINLLQSLADHVMSLF